MHINDVLIKACELGHLAVVEYALKNGANVHAEDDCALGWASENGHADVVKLLNKAVG